MYEPLFKWTAKLTDRQLHIVEVDLDREGDAVPQQMASVRSFIDRSIKWNFPANTFFVIDAKVNANTGGFVYQKGIQAGGMLAGLLGEDPPKSLKQASEVAQNGERSRHKVWYDDAPFSSGGWRCLRLATGGSVVRFTRDRGMNFTLDTRIDKHDAREREEPAELLVIR